jgi:hypothetical protein
VFVRKSYGLRDSLALSSLLFLCRWRQQSVQAQVHGSRAVVVGPVIGQGDEGESSQSLAATEEFHRVPSLESSTLPRAVPQKSKLALSAPMSLFFPSVPFRPGVFASGTSPILAQRYCRRIVLQNSTASLDLWRASSSTKSKKSGTQSNSASVTLLAVCT